jgi:hypothetical protein
MNAPAEAYRFQALAKEIAAELRGKFDAIRPREASDSPIFVQCGSGDALAIWKRGASERARFLFVSSFS